MYILLRGKATFTDCNIVYVYIYLYCFKTFDHLCDPSSPTRSDPHILSSVTCSMGRIAMSFRLFSRACVFFVFPKHRPPKCRILKIGKSLDLNGCFMFLNIHNLKNPIISIKMVRMAGMFLSCLNSKF